MILQKINSICLVLNSTFQAIVQLLWSYRSYTRIVFSLLPRPELKHGEEVNPVFVLQTTQKLGVGGLGMKLDNVHTKFSESAVFSVGRTGFVYNDLHYIEFVAIQ